MRRASATSQWGRRVQVPPSGSGASLGRISPQVRTTWLAEASPTGTSGSAGFGMRSSSSSSWRLRGRQLGVELLDLDAGVRGGLPERRDLGPVRRGALADRLADLLGGGVALGLEPVRVAEQLAALALQRQSLIHERRVLALVDRALADPIRLLAQPCQPDAHASLTPVVPAAVWAAARAASLLSLAWAMSSVRVEGRMPADGRRHGSGSRLNRRFARGDEKHDRDQLPSRPISPISHHIVSGPGSWPNPDVAAPVSPNS